MLCSGGRWGNEKRTIIYKFTFPEKARFVHFSFIQVGYPQPDQSNHYQPSSLSSLPSVLNPLQQCCLTFLSCDIYNTFGLRRHYGNILPTKLFTIKKEILDEIMQFDTEQFKNSQL